MFFKLSVDWLHCGIPTEGGLLNDRDEIYFAISGGSIRGAIPQDKTRISPPHPEDYYGMKQGDARNDIELWEGFVPMNTPAPAAFAVSLCEQDNAQVAAMITLAGGAAKLIVSNIGAFASGQPLNIAALADAVGQATKEFITSLSAEGDQVIGAFNIIMKNDNGNIVPTWTEAEGATLLTPPNEPSAQFRLASGASYEARLSLQRSALVAIINKKSDKALDVPDGDKSPGVQVQQYGRHDGPNQRWLLKRTGWAMFPFFPYATSAYTIFSDNSGLCLDVRGGERVPVDGTAVQQYTPHGGLNQQWALVPFFDGSGDIAILSAQSGKALEIADGVMDDHALLQINRPHYQQHQRWQFTHINISWP